MKVCIHTGGYPLFKKHDDDAGFDIRLPEDVTIKPKGSAFVDLKVAVEIPKNHVGILLNRSSIAVNDRCISNTGIIDCGYTGSLKIHLENHNNTSIEYNQGDRIAQLLVVPCLIDVAEYVDKLEETDRGSAGFGSTGRA